MGTEGAERILCRFISTQEAERDREEGVGQGYKTLELDLGNAFSSKILSLRGSMTSPNSITNWDQRFKRL